MIRSVLIKGVEALGVEAYVTAERQGILKEVMECMGDVDKLGFAGSSARWCRPMSCMRIAAGRRWGWSARRCARPASIR